MKLAEALGIRSDLERKLGDLKARIDRNAVLQEGDTQPVEDPMPLMVEAERVLERLRDLLVTINRTNMQEKLDSKTLMEQVAERERLKRTRGIYESAVKAAQPSAPRWGRQELRNIPTVNVPEMQQKIDELTTQIRRLDTKLQEMNWSVSCVE